MINDKLNIMEESDMEKSKVYFTNMKASFNENLPQKLKRLIRTAGIEEIDFYVQTMQLSL